MNIYYLASVASGIALAALTTVWFADGMQIYTKDKREVITKEVDPLFGSTVEKREFVEDFQLGLLPGDDEDVSKMFLSLGVSGGALLALSAAFFLLGKRKPTQ